MPVELMIRIERPIDLQATLGPLRRGGADPTIRCEPDGVWRATRTPDGPAAEHLMTEPSAVRAEAWGPGAAWALERAPALIGCLDDPDAFEAHHPLLRELHRRFPGLRLGRSNAVVEALVPSILGQKVPDAEAHRSYTRLVCALGEPAPGPAGLLLPPAPEALAALPYHAYHPLDVERRRAETIRAACSRANRMEEAASMPPADAERRLRSIPGIGVWTAAEVRRIALGDPDAVSVGDYHLPNLVSWALAGEPRGDDERMLELLEPYLGQRGRVQRLLEVSGLRPPRYGPRTPLRSIASI